MAAAAATHGADPLVTIETDLAAVAEVVDLAHHPASVMLAMDATVTTVAAEPQCETRMFLLEKIKPPDVAEADVSTIDAADLPLPPEVARPQRAHALFLELLVSHAAAGQSPAAAALRDAVAHHRGLVHVQSLLHAREPRQPDRDHLPETGAREADPDHLPETGAREADLDRQSRKEASGPGRARLSETEPRAPDPQAVELDTAAATALTVATVVDLHHLLVLLQTLSDVNIPSLAAAAAAGVAPEVDHRAEDATLDPHPRDHLGAAAAA